MDNECMKKCPYCAEMIRAEAIKCRYCGSNLSGRNSWTGPSASPQYWQRVKEGKIIAGVSTGISRQFDAPILVLPLRLFFLLTAIFWGFGVILYVVLWILMPPPTDQPKQGPGAYAPPPPYPPPPPVREEPRPPRSEQPSPPAGEEPPRNENPPEESPQGESSPGDTPRGDASRGNPPPVGNPFGEPPRGESAAGAASHENSNLRNGLTLLLVVTAGIFITLWLLSADLPFWGPHLHGSLAGPFSHFPMVEWVKMALVAGVVLIILAGMGFVAIGIIPLALVAAGSVFFLRSMHVISARGMMMALLTAAILLIAFWGIRLFRRQPKMMNHSA